MQASSQEHSPRSPLCGVSVYAPVCARAERYSYARGPRTPPRPGPRRRSSAPAAPPPTCHALPAALRGGGRRVPASGRRRLGGWKGGKSAAGPAQPRRRLWRWGFPLLLRVSPRCGGWGGRGGGAAGAGEEGREGGGKEEPPPPPLWGGRVAHTHTGTVCGRGGGGGRRRSSPRRSPGTLRSAAGPAAAPALPPAPAAAEVRRLWGAARVGRRAATVGGDRWGPPGLAAASRPSGVAALPVPPLWAVTLGSPLPSGQPPGGSAGSGPRPRRIGPLPRRRWTYTRTRMTVCTSVWDCICISISVCVCVWLVIELFFSCSLPAELCSSL